MSKPRVHLRWRWSKWPSGDAVESVCGRLWVERWTDALAEVTCAQCRRRGCAGDGSPGEIEVQVTLEGEP